MTSPKAHTCYVFVINNPKQQLPLLKDDYHPASESIRYAVWQLEIGKKGTPHIQGYLELYVARTIVEIHSEFDFLQRAALFPRKGTQTQAILYSTKTSTRHAGPYEYGTPSNQVRPHPLLDVLLGTVEFPAFFPTIQL